MSTSGHQASGVSTLLKKNVSCVKIMRKEGANLLMTSGHQASGLYTNLKNKFFRFENFDTLRYSSSFAKILLFCAHMTTIEVKVG